MFFFKNFIWITRIFHKPHWYLPEHMRMPLTSYTSHIDIYLSICECPLLLTQATLIFTWAYANAPYFLHKPHWYLPEHMRMPLTSYTSHINIYLSICECPLLLTQATLIFTWAYANAPYFLHKPHWYLPEHMRMPLTSYTSHIDIYLSICECPLLLTQATLIFTWAYANAPYFLHKPHWYLPEHMRMPLTSYTSHIDIYLSICECPLLLTQATLIFTWAYANAPYFLHKPHWYLPEHMRMPLTSYTSHIDIYLSICECPLLLTQATLIFTWAYANAPYFLHKPHWYLPEHMRMPLTSYTSHIDIYLSICECPLLLTQATLIFTWVYANAPYFLHKPHWYLPEYMRMFLTSYTSHIDIYLSICECPLLLTQATLIFTWVYANAPYFLHKPHWYLPEYMRMPLTSYTSHIDIYLSICECSLLLTQATLIFTWVYANAPYFLHKPHWYLPEYMRMPLTSYTSHIDIYLSICECPLLLTQATLIFTWVYANAPYFLHKPHWYLPEYMRMPLTSYTSHIDIYLSICECPLLLTQATLIFTWAYANAPYFLHILLLFWWRMISRKFPAWQ